MRKIILFLVLFIMALTIAVSIHAVNNDSAPPRPNDPDTLFSKAHSDGPCKIGPSSCVEHNDI